MKKRSAIFVFFSIFVILLFFATPSFAGPGGFIARLIIQTFWGKVFVAGMTLFFLPLILYTLIREKIAEKRTLRDLSFMADLDHRFDWDIIRRRIDDCFSGIHRAWRMSDLKDAASFMTSWYMRNQQLTVLDQWEREELRNDCAVEDVMEVRPIFFHHRNEGGEHEGSLLVVSIVAKMKDCLREIDTGEVFEGELDFKDHQTIWSFTLNGEDWRVSKIEDSDLSLVYARQTRYLPDIRDTLLQPVNEDETQPSSH